MVNPPYPVLVAVFGGFVMFPLKVTSPLVVSKTPVVKRVTGMDDVMDPEDWSVPEKFWKVREEGLPKLAEVTLRTPPSRYKILAKLLVPVNVRVPCPIFVSDAPDPEMLPPFMVKLYVFVEIVPISLSTRLAVELEVLPICRVPPPDPKIMDEEDPKLRVLNVAPPLIVVVPVNVSVPRKLGVPPVKARFPLPDTIP